MSVRKRKARGAARLRGRRGLAHRHGLGDPGDGELDVLVGPGPAIGPEVELPLGEDGESGGGRGGWPLGSTPLALAKGSPRPAGGEDKWGPRATGRTWK